MLTMVLGAVQGRQAQDICTCTALRSNTKQRQELIYLIRNLWSSACDSD